MSEYINDYISGQMIKATPEEVQGVQPLLKALEEDYGYPKDCIVAHPQYRVKAKPSDRSGKYPVDVAVFRTPEKKDSELLIIGECKNATRKDGIEQLEDYMRLSRARYGIWFNGKETSCIRKIESRGTVVFEEISDIPKAKTTIKNRMKRSIVTVCRSILGRLDKESQKDEEKDVVQEIPICSEDIEESPIVTEEIKEPMISIPATAILLIGIQFGSTLLENKLIAATLYKIKEATKDKEGSFIVKMPATELKQQLGVSGNSIYERIGETAEAMTGRTIGMFAPDTQRVDYIEAVDKANYECGVLTVEYNRHLNEYLENIESSFTIKSIDTMMQVNSVYTFRLYEILKSYCYIRMEEPKTDKYSMSINLSELQFDLGIINANEDRVKRVLRGSSTPDYDEAARVAKEKMYTKWYEFKRQVLDVAVQEINTNKEAMMQIEYEANKHGRGGRVVNVTFLITMLNGDDD